MRFLKYIIQGIMIVLAMIISSFMKIRKSNRDIWLVGERKSEAKDNGYHLFKFIRLNYKNEKIYYVIEKNSTDIKKIYRYGNIIHYNSFRHYVYYCMANKLICSHAGSTVPSSPIFWRLRDINRFKKKVIYIKHGIIKEKIKTHMYENTNYDIICCGAKPEYDFVKSELGYPENNVKYIGLCRFDNLHNFKFKKQIFIMLTWRSWFDLEESIQNFDVNLEEFLRSEYYKKIDNLLNDKKFINLIEKAQMEVIFHPHHEIQRYISHFKTSSKNIIIADENKYDIQELLRNSSILITDYSSIAFDFGYMRKPVIYYQFDSKRYYQEHYSKGYFDYRKDGFGPVATCQDELNDALYNIFINGKEIDYKNRVDKFFALNDMNNCYRTYEVIKEI